MISLALNQAARSAQEILAEVAVSALPVDPYAIAQQYEIECRSGHLEGCSGCLTLRNGAFRIVYHGGWGEGFSRFTVAHELGHYFIPGHPQALFPDNAGEHRSDSGYTSKDGIEREADHFATNLLMPASLFSVALGRQAGRGLSAIEALADECATSLTATSIRYAELCDVPVAVILSSGERVNWCFRSEPFKEICPNWLPKGSIVPPASATHEFNKNEPNVVCRRRREQSSYLDAWLDDAPSVEMQEDILGLGRYGKTLTVLFLDEVPTDDEEGW